MGSTKGTDGYDKGCVSGGQWATRGLMVLATMWTIDAWHEWGFIQITYMLACGMVPWRWFENRGRAMLAQNNCEGVCSLLLLVADKMVPELILPSLWGRVKGFVLLYSSGVMG